MKGGKKNITHLLKKIVTQQKVTADKLKSPIKTNAFIVLYKTNAFLCRTI